MNKNNNVSTIIIATIIIVAVSFLIWGGSKNKTSAPVVDQHGMSVAANISAASLDDLVNKSAPDFALADKDGKLYSLNELRGKNIILFFNEGLMCYPACWNQIVALDKDEIFKNTDTVILSVVVDPPEEWQKAIEQMPELAEATVVFDKDAAISKRFNMLTTASSMHYGSLPGHTFVLINKEGIIKHIFDDPNMSIHNDQLVAEISKL
ncbi:MAG: Alkyl hydroperoxide reductase/ Thiol specific antioxidant/ Mal allergen [Candidatus Roizmanbacteria bacterium GW2011_GWC2_41_7]|uniref:Alkyl hydroperoxide reductase/ Thiol specific antioxidant/ Mal allergen n=1 Tax=Candidatus Roizmanbacteria bacterium GW2011_GWC2_41_7 TaxID=1618487 RepID=A0A0G0X4P6_9BACT|nr:MAG: Alkyl hydroperoxide reductase/ Thiol specific antioxidant/ Mal allergen [Candidatus Roizmanbacteria bacterium GW2011_GWC2_41_7]